MSITVSIINQANGNEISSRQLPAGGSIQLQAGLTGLAGLPEPWLLCTCDIQAGNTNLFHDEQRASFLGNVEFNGFHVPEGSGAAQIIITAHYPTGSDDSVTLPVAWGSSTPGPLPGPVTVASSVSGIVVVLGVVAIAAYAFTHWYKKS